MKPSKYMYRMVMLLLLLGTLSYFGYYAYHSFFASYESATVYEYTSQHTISANGYLIREEQVLQDGGNLEEVVVMEGENVAKGDVVARVYSTQEALTNHQELERLRSQLARMEYMRQRGADQSDAMKVNQEIVDAITSLRGSMGVGDFSRLSHQVSNLEELVFRRDYTISTGSSLSDQISALQSQVEALSQETESATSTVYSPVAGIYSAMVDGYESTFDLETLRDMTPNDLLQAASHHSTPSGRELGKVVTSFRWYFAAIMDQEVTRYLAGSDGVQLLFEGSAGQLSMQVDNVSNPDEKGRVLVLFSSMRDVSSIAALRSQHVELSLGSATGLRIPARALRADQETGQLGVYRVSGAQADWVPVDLVFSGTDFYLVRTHVDGEQSTLDKAKMLRSGDQVLIQGTGLADGKVVE